MECLIIEQESNTTLIAFNQFLSDWDKRYQGVVQKNPLFHPEITTQWSIAQKKQLVGYLYHIRGHFHELLWEMGNSAPDSDFKEMIIDNIRDEFGGNGLSHEKLYYLFAEHFGLDLTLELLDNRYYADFIKHYQNTVLRWFKKADWDYKLSAFAAIERLDNIDYANLLGLANSLDSLLPRETAFFYIHMNVAHFSDKMKAALFIIWSKNRGIIEESFQVVLTVQTAMWQALFEHIHQNNQGEHYSTRQPKETKNDNR